MSPTRTPVGSGSTPACPICRSSRILPFSSRSTFRCRECSHCFSTLQPRINEASADSTRADIEVKLALRSVREDVYRESLELLESEFSGRPVSGLRHLDVGCSIGQFLEVSKRHGMRGEGIEPERAFAALARAKGHLVHEGYFPAAIGSDARFDLISFMDVAGHMPDLLSVGRSAIERLADGGRIMIKTPAAGGILFQTGRALRAAGSGSLWRRLWQVDFASPQIHFFTPASMERFAREIGGRVTAAVRLPALKREGLWQRMLPGEKIPLWRAIPIYCVLSLLLPFINRLPRDSLLVLIEAGDRDED